MIGTELIEGYGLGNQLFFYIVTRCLALDKGTDFGFVNPGQIGNVAQSKKGMYFMDIDMGKEISREDMKNIKAAVKSSRPIITGMVFRRISIITSHINHIITYENTR